MAVKKMLAMAVHAAQRLREVRQDRPEDRAVDLVAVADAGLVHAQTGARRGGERGATSDRVVRGAGRAPDTSFATALSSPGAPGDASARSASSRAPTFSINVAQEGTSRSTNGCWRPRSSSAAEMRSSIPPSYLVPLVP
jgi:hypothetical protein